MIGHYFIFENVVCLFLQKKSPSTHDMQKGFIFYLFQFDILLPLPHLVNHATATTNCNGIVMFVCIGHKKG